MSEHRTRESLERQVTDSAPLLRRLDECCERVAKMCAERRGPRMTIPVQWYDDDFFICATVGEAIAELLWQPIETAPKDRQIDLWTVTDVGQWRVPGAWWTDENGWIWGEAATFYRVAGTSTHWRPIPAAPIAAKR